MTPFARDIRTVPNLLSLGRVLLVLVTIVVIVVFDQMEIGLALGFLAGFTDFLDGYFARKLNQSTDLGVVLDQYSDLVYEGLFFLLLTTFGTGLHPIFLGGYLAREFWVMSMRRLMAERGMVTRSSLIGKIKTHLYSYGFILYWCHLGQLMPTVDCMCIGPEFLCSPVDSCSLTGAGFFILWILSMGTMPMRRKMSSPDTRSGDGLCYALYPETRRFDIVRQRLKTRQDHRIDDLAENRGERWGIDKSVV